MSEDTLKEAIERSKEAGTNKILADSFGVDTGEVDAVHGAKPEPEERPFFEERILEANKVQLSDGTIFTGKAHSLMIESTVDREMLAFGKCCYNCKNFSHEIGQAEIARMTVMGTPEETKMLAEMRFQIMESGVVDTQGDFIGYTQIFKDETEEFMSQYGSCMFGTAHQADTQLVHPTQQGCPSLFASGEPWPWQYIAKNEEVEKRDKLIFDSLMQTAARNKARLAGK